MSRCIVPVVEWVPDCPWESGRIVVFLGYVWIARVALPVGVGAPGNDPRWTRLAPITPAASAVAPERTISAGGALTGGGDLSADRTISLAALSPSPAATFTAGVITQVDAYGRVLSVEEYEGGGGADLSQRVYSPVDRAVARTPLFLTQGSYTWGGAWSAWRAVSVTGVRLRWAGAGQTLTFKIKDGAGADVRTCTVSVTGAGTYTGTFGSPWTPTIGDRWYLCQVGGTGVSYCADPDQESTPGHPLALDHAIQSYGLNLYISGEAVPTNVQAGDMWAFEPTYSLT